jgi:hypothetical protein
MLSAYKQCRYSAGETIVKPLLVLAVVLVLLVVMVSSVSAHNIIDSPEPDIVPTDQISLNNIVNGPPRPDPVSNGTMTVQEVQVPTDPPPVKKIG